MSSAQEGVEATLGAFLSYGAQARSVVDAQREVFSSRALRERLPNLSTRFDAQADAIGINDAFIHAMLTELNMLQPEAPAQAAGSAAVRPADEPEDTDSEEAALLRAVVRIRHARANASAREVRDALISEPRWASDPPSMSAVKRACSKASKAAAAAAPERRDESRRGGAARLPRGADKSSAAGRARNCAGSTDAEGAPDGAAGAAAAQENVAATLLQLRREWSDEAEEERSRSFGVLVDALARLAPRGEGGGGGGDGEGGGGGGGGDGGGSPLPAARAAGGGEAPVPTMVGEVRLAAGAPEAAASRGAERRPADVAACQSALSYMTCWGVDQAFDNRCHCEIGLRLPLPQVHTLTLTLTRPLTLTLASPSLSPSPSPYPGHVWRARARRALLFPHAAQPDAAPPLAVLRTPDG